VIVVGRREPGSLNPGEVRVEDLLAEVPPGHPEWVTGVARRLVAASSRPVVVDEPEGPLRRRLEAAGWLVLPAGADAASARMASWSAAPALERLAPASGVGSLAPEVVVVGDAPTRDGQVPFHSRSGTWLFAALRMMGYDELRVRVLNALDANRRKVPQETLIATWTALQEAAPNPPTWLACGQEAAEWLRAAGLVFVEVPNPQWHKQYRAAEGVAGYALRMREAGLQPGPYETTALPVVTAEKLPDMPPPLGMLAKSVAYRRPPSRGTGRFGVNKQKLEQARRIYVTGEVRTAKEAAAKVGLHAGRVQAAARDQGWDAERAQHARAVTEAAKQKALESEAKSLANSRQLAWVATELALADTVERLRAGRGVADSLAKLAKQKAAGDDKATPLHPTPLQARALGQLAVLLGRGGGADGDDLQGKSLRDLAREVATQLGEDEDDGQA
jgi:hypothetical protein